MKNSVTVATTTGPLLMDLWGVHIPALSAVMGLLSVVAVRIMLMAKDFENTVSFWYYNISLTVLMMIITFAIIADRQLESGLSVMVGTGIGASGMVLIDILKDRVQSVLRAAIGTKEK